LAPPWKGRNLKLFTVLKGWNLGADTLDEQSDVCLTFLAKLLRP
jgi:hypothetical protein